MRTPRARHRAGRRRALRRRRSRARAGAQLRSARRSRAVGRRARDRGGAGGAPHRAVVSRGARRPACNSTTSCARSAGRSRCRPRCGASATCSSAAGWRKRIAAMAEMATAPLAQHTAARAWYAALYRAMRAQVDGRRRRSGAPLRRSARDRASRSARVPPGSATPCSRCSSHGNDASSTGSSRCSTRWPPSTRTNRASSRPRRGCASRPGSSTKRAPQFERSVPTGSHSIPRNGVWLPNMRLLSEIAYALATPGPAATLYELLLPYRDRFIVTSRVLSVPRVGRARTRPARDSRTGELDRRGGAPRAARASARRARRAAAHGAHRPRARRRCARHAATAPGPPSSGHGCTPRASRTVGSTCATDAAAGAA